MWENGLFGPYFLILIRFTKGLLTPAEFSVHVCGRRATLFYKGRGTAHYISKPNQIQKGPKRKVWYGNTLGSHMTSGFLLAGKKKLWFGNSLQCIGLSLSLFWSGNSKHFLAQALCSDQHLLRIPTPSATENQPKKVLKFPSIYL